MEALLTCYSTSKEAHVSGVACYCRDTEGGVKWVLVAIIRSLALILSEMGATGEL